MNVLWRRIDDLHDVRLSRLKASNILVIYSDESRKGISRFDIRTKRQKRYQFTILLARSIL